MVTIAITNKNPDSQYGKVVIDIKTGKSLLDDQQEVDRRQLLSLGFQHPLLTDTSIPNDNTVFQYQYDDIDGLLHSARYVYEVLLKVDNPLACKFKINPSPLFEYPNVPDSIYFSIYSNKFAQDVISISQLEGIVEALKGYKFEFLDGIIIDEEFTVEALPKSIDGDLLYKTNLEIVDLLKTPSDLDRYELRYINPTINLGVFSREIIKKDETLFFYGGLKKNHDSEDVSYAFNFRSDSLNMFIDARECGNIGRFVNHAPNPVKDSPPSKDQTVLEANVTSFSHYLKGVEIVVFTADRDILKGEQLLVDYGSPFFESRPMKRFKANGKASVGNVFKSNAQKKVAQIRAMANHGVHKAHQYLLLRMLSIVGVVVALMGIMSLFV